MVGSNSLRVLILAVLSLMASASNGINGKNFFSLWVFCRLCWFCFTSLNIFFFNFPISEEKIPLKEIFVPLGETPTKLEGIFNPELDESDAEYWRLNAQQYLQNVLDDPQKQMKPKKAKNVIIFLGDGMSFYFWFYVFDAAAFIQLIWNILYIFCLNSHI